MADPKTSQAVQDAIRLLVEKYREKRISLEDYAKELQEQTKLLSYYQEIETYPKIDIASEEEDLSMQVLDQQEKLAGEYAMLEEDGLSVEEAFARGRAKVEKDLLPQMYTTSDFVEKIPAKVGVSNVRDAQRGLIRDPDTGILRKASRYELLKEIPYRQVLQTDSTKRELKAERANKYQQMYSSLRKKGFSKEESKQKVQNARDVEEGLYPIQLQKDYEIEGEDETEGQFLIEGLEDFVEKPSKETAMVVESPTATALRWLNVPSALTATYLEDINNVIGVITGAPVSTRKDAGYKPPEGQFKNELGSQFLTNALLGQGIITQQQAQLNPADEDYDGLFNIATQGSYGSMGLGLMAEFGDLMPLDVALGAKALTAGALKSTKSVPLQKAGMAVDSPIEPLRYAGSKAEIKRAMKSVDENISVKDLEKEIVNNGGVLNRGSLRDKASEAVGDVIGGYKAIKEHVNSIPSSGMGQGTKKVTSADIDVPQSTFIKNFFGKDGVLQVEQINKKIRQFERRLASVSPRGEKQVTALNKVKSIADDTVDSLILGTKPVRESRQVNRGINSALMTETKVWDDLIKGGKVTDDLTKDWTRGRILTLQSARQPLKASEIIELGEVWNKVTNGGKSIDRGIKQSSSTIYQSVRNNVSDTLKDNFLKNIPDDYIYVTKDVAVPFKNTQGPLIKRYQKEIQSYLPSLGVLDKPKAIRLLQLERKTGQSFSKPVQQKLLKTVEGPGNVSFNPREIREIQSVVSSELALDFMGGVRLQEGTLTGKMAELTGTARTSFISPESGKLSSFNIQTQGVLNAVRLLTENIPAVQGVFDWASTGWFNNRFGSLSPTISRFNKSQQDASRLAVDQVTKRLSQTGTQDPTVSFNNNLEYYNQMGIQNRKVQLESTKIRSSDEIADIDPLARSEFVGKVDYKSLYRPVEEVKKKSQVQKQKVLSQESQKIQQRFEQRVQTAEDRLINLFEKDLERINRKYNRKKIELGLRKEKLSSVKTQKSKTKQDRITNTIGVLKQEALAEVAKHKKMYTETRALLDEATKQERSFMYDKVGEIVDGKKLQTLQTKTDQKIQKLQEAIEQRIEKLEIKEVEKSATVAKNRRLQAVSDKYGRDNVESFMQQQGIGNTYEDLINNIEFLETNMEVAVDQIYRMDTWKKVVDRFFTAPAGTKETAKVNLKYKWIDRIEDIVRIDKTKPYWMPNNIRPLTIEDFKDVIAKLREIDKSLENYGLTTMRLPFVKQKEMYTLPLIEHMIKTQRTSNMSRAIDDFMREDGGIFINMQRDTNQTLGLENTKVISELIVNRIKHSTQYAVRKGLLGEDVVNILTHQIRETLFDGMMKDVWASSGRNIQEGFLNRYLRKMVEDNTTVVRDMDDFLSSLYSGPNPLLKSNTWKNVEAQVDKVVAQLEEDLSTLQLTTKEQKTIDYTKELLSELKNSMGREYTNALLVRTDGVYDGVFSRQLQSLNDYMSRYGIDPNVAMKNIKELSPRFEYMGSKNVGLIYGNIEASKIEKLIELASDSASSKLMNDLIQTSANRTLPSMSATYLKDYAGSAANATRRWAISTMLGGAITVPSMRFFTINRLTAPIIMMATLGDKMKVSSMAQATGLAVTGGLLSSKRLPLLSKIKSNRYMFAPDDEIILTTADGAIRDFTAKELRTISEEQGVLYSRADSDFYDTQFTKLLIDSGMTVDGLGRYTQATKNKILLKLLGPERAKIPQKITNKVLDNLAPGRNNIWNEFAKFQDTEMRRFVFIDSLKQGKTIDESVSLAKRSMLDYSSLSDFERQTVSKAIYFYSFMRTMGAETINSVYRSVKAGKMNTALRSMSMIDRYYRQTDKDYSSWDSLMRSRLYQEYIGTIDGHKIYAGGAPNPMMQGFEFMAMAGLYMLDSVNTDKTTAELEYNLWSSFADIAATASTTIAEGSPFGGLALELYKQNDPFLTKRPIPFPSELIDRAEEAGYLDELVNTYGLVKRSRTPGRPLSKEGDYYDFPTTERGKSSYQMYVLHRMIGLTAFAIPVYAMGYTGAQTRGIKDMWRARMFAKPDMTVPSPTGEGTIRIPTASPFLKTLSSNEMDAAFYHYYMGLYTPNRARPLSETRAYQLNSMLFQINKAQERLGSD